MNGPTMDPQVRNFRDFLMLYNKLTEMCFTQCTDNFNNRKISDSETDCIDKCVHKYTAVNQKIMGIYVEAQTAINARHVAEQQVKAAEAAAAAAAAAAATHISAGTADASDNSVAAV